jgi:DNA-binding MarR family transcriptional regulator
MNFVEPDDDGWPRMRPSNVDVRVIGSVFGAYHALKHRLDRALNEHGLDSSEGLVLAAIHLEPRCAPLDIRRRLGFHRSTLSSILDRLERDRLIDRPPSAFNGQRFELFLTPLGEIAADIADYVITEVETELAAYTSRQERQGALDLFGACVAIDRPDRTIS